MKIMIATPNKTEMCGMYQLAKDLAKELNADIITKEDNPDLQNYDKIITFLYPMHKLGKKAKKIGKRWICYDQKVPEPNKQHFPNFFRRQYMKVFYWFNEQSKQGADEYWELSEIEQKPRWTEKIPLPFKIYKGVDLTKPYFIYTGRTTDYKNFEWLQQTMNELEIPFVHPENESDEIVHALLSNACGYATASVWEGYGRPVMEAQALGIPVVCFDTGVHKKLVKKGFVVENHNFYLFKEKLKEVWQIYSASQSFEESLIGVKLNKMPTIIEQMAQKCKRKTCEHSNFIHGDIFRNGEGCLECPCPQFEGG